VHSCPFVVNKTHDAWYRGQSFTPPANLYFGLILGKGAWAATTAYSVGDLVIPTVGNGRIYRCTTAGTSGSSQPTWPTTRGGTVSDGGAVWTEASNTIEAGTFSEPNSGGYARVQLTASLAAWAGTQGAGTTVASSGTAGQSTGSNNGAVAFPTSSAAFANGGLTQIIGVAVWDASSAGNLLFVLGGNSALTVSSAGVTLSYAAGQLQGTWSN
jgi:hypothetical protein